MTQSKLRGILYIIAAAFCFALMNLFVRQAGALPTFEKGFFRNLVAFLFAFYIIKRERITFQRLDKTAIKYLTIRATAGTVGIFCNFYAIDRLVIADASMLNKLSPFFAIIFSFLLLKEKVKPFQIACIMGAFVGVLFILKPGVGLLSSFPGWMGLLGGMGAGLAYTYVRIAGQYGVPGPMIVLYFSAFSCVVSFLFSLPFFVVPSGMQLISLLLAGLSAAGGQFAITAAYTHAPAREISIYDYSQIIFAALIGWLVLGEVPDRYSVMGYLIICSASLVMFLRQRKEPV